jgi:hypothetical protein
MSNKELNTESMILKIGCGGITKVNNTDRQHCRDIFDEVLAERDYQDQKWGGAQHDDNEENEQNWQRYITEYANAQGRADGRPFRTRMVKVAALAFAAIESYDRKNV